MTGLGSGVLPSHRSLRYSSAPTFGRQLSSARNLSTAYLIPPGSVCPDLDQLFVELLCLFVGKLALELGRVDGEI